MTNSLHKEIAATGTLNTRKSWKCQPESAGFRQSRADQLESSTAGENLSVPLETKLNTSQQCSLMAKVAISLLACIRKSTSSRLRNMILPLYSALVRHDWSAGFTLGIPENMGLPCTEETWTYLSRSSKRSTKMVKSLEHHPIRKGWELGLSGIGEEKAQDHLINVYKYLMGGSKWDEARLRSGVQWLAMGTN